METSQIQERKQPPKSRKCRVPYSRNPRSNTPRHMLIKQTKIKDKDKLLKAAREKGIPIRLPVDCSSRNYAGQKGKA